MVFCQIDDKLLEVLHRVADGRKFVDLGAGEAMFEHLYTKKYPDHGVVSVELYPEHYDHFYIKRNKLVRFSATMMVFDKTDLPIFIRPYHSDGFVPVALENMRKQVSEAIYISNPRNVERDIPEEYCYVLVPGWVGSEGEQIYLILLDGEKYIREDVEWFMVKLEHWPAPIKLKKVLRDGVYFYVNTKGGGFPCTAAEFAEPVK